MTNVSLSDPGTSSPLTQQRRMAWLDLWFRFSGRASRFDYIVRFLLPSVLVQILARLLAEGGLGMIALSLLLSLTIAYCGIAALVKRLHDLDRSSWYLLQYFVAYLAAFVVLGLLVGLGRLASAGSSAQATAIVVGAVAPLGVTIWYFIDIFCRRGTVGPNRFGEDPVR